MTRGDEFVQRRQGGEGGAIRLSPRLARHLLIDVQHGADVARLADGDADRWTDALLAETRFHLAGLLNAVQLAIDLELAGDPASAALTQLGHGYARHAMEQNPALLSPELLGHLRRRAAVSLIMRQNRITGAHAGLSSLGGKDNFRYLDALTDLGIAERRWHGPMLLDAPMRPDLPAEHYHDLVWTVTALLVRGAEQLRGETDPVLVASLARAAEVLIARHDEGQGAIALAQRCARSLSSNARFLLAPAALTEARLLLFAAIVESEAGLALDDVLEALLGEQDSGRHALMRLMEIEDAVAFHVAEMVAPVTGRFLGGDAELVDFIEAYRAFDAGQAVQWLVDRLSPRPLADKLALFEASS
jgi:hypothetical protein